MGVNEQILLCTKQKHSLAGSITVGFMGCTCFSPLPSLRKICHYKLVYSKYN